VVVQPVALGDRKHHIINSSRDITTVVDVVLVCMRVTCNHHQQQQLPLSVLQ
jgi:hypothetical protein